MVMRMQKKHLRCDNISPHPFGEASVGCCLFSSVLASCAIHFEQLKRLLDITTDLIKFKWGCPPLSQKLWLLNDKQLGTIRGLNIEAVKCVHDSPTALLANEDWNIILGDQGKDWGPFFNLAAQTGPPQLYGQNTTMCAIFQNNLMQ